MKHLVGPKRSNCFYFR